MAKRKIKISLKNNDEVIESELSALIIDNKIKYIDNDILVNIDINNDYIIMKRENNEYQLILVFKNKMKTTGSYLLKENNVQFELDILTNDLIIEKEFISIIYEINNESKEYELEIRE